LRSLISVLLAVGGIVLVLAMASTTRAAEPEFGGSCAMGLAEGKRIKTDCRITWTDEKDGKLYCFGNEDSKTAFLKDPEGNLAKAKETYAAAETEDTGSSMGKFTADDVTKFTETFVAAAAEKNGGLFPLNDSMLGQTLPLRFVKVDFVRTLHGYGFFPNTLFADKDDATKTYQVDFWVKPKAGKLEVVDVRVYKAPKKEGEKWVMFTRQPKPWWWIPASEHPGESEVKRGWEVMSALHEHIAAERAKGGGLYKLKDDKTGEVLDLDFIGIHQPVRKLKEDGRFFACTDFRKDGSKEQYYDIDFWLDEKSGKITVGNVRVHKVPTLEDGNYVQIPRYNFDPKTFDVVP
jgi:YHS domain-containing protein